MPNESIQEQLINRCNKVAVVLSEVIKLSSGLHAILSDEVLGNEVTARSFNDFTEALEEMSAFWMELYSYVLDAPHD